MGIPRTRWSSRGQNRMSPGTRGFPNAGHRCFPRGADAAPTPPPSWDTPVRRPARCGCGGREPRHVYLFSTKPTARRVLSEVRSGRPLAAAQRRPDGEKQQKADRERSTARRAPVERTAPAERDVRRPFEADIGRARLRGFAENAPSSARPRRGRAACPGRKEYCATPSQSTAESFDEDLAEDASLDPPLSSETPSQDTSQDTSQDERRRLFGSSARVTRAEARRDRWKNAASPGGLLQRVQLYAPRFPVVSSAFLLAALAVFAPVVDRAYHKLHTEGRVVSDVASVAYDVGRFTVAWDATALRLAVTHDDEVDDDDAAKISRARRRGGVRGRGPRPRRLAARLAGSPLASRGPPSPGRRFS